MNLSKFALSLYAEGVPVLVGWSDAFTELHARMKAAIIVQHCMESYERGYNFAIISPDDLFDALYSMVLESVRCIHEQAFQCNLVLSPNNKRICWAYVLDDKRPSVGVWHNHISTSSYNAVYYLAAQLGDAIEVIIPTDLRNPEVGQFLQIPVQEGTLLVMPNWLFHKEKPIEPSAGAFRISINMEILADPSSWPADFAGNKLWRFQMDAQKL